MSAQVLECQTCGNVLRVLDAAEARRVADSPYDFIAYCRQCRQEQHAGGDL